MSWPVEGVDAAWGRPTPAQLVAAGKRFVIGYVSRDPAKNLTAHECTAYLAAGVAVGLVWETTARRALDGATAGRVDGIEARRQARALTFPDDRPIYTAVDFDASDADLAGPVRNYLAAFAANVGGTALAGVYGGIRTVAYALDHHLVGHGWQAYAWSGGRWDARASVQQYRNGVPIAGHDTDLDRAADLATFWTQGSTDMSLTPTDAHTVWASSLEIPNMEDRSKPNVTPATALAQAWDAAVVIPPHVDATVAAAVTAINAHTDAALAGAATAPGATLSQADLDAIRSIVREELATLKITTG